MSTSENNGDEASGDSTPDLSEGLTELQTVIQDQLVQVDESGERIKVVSAQAILGKVNHEIVTDLQEEIVDLLGEQQSTHDEVTINEITLALWAELDRIAQMATTDHADAAPPSEDKSRGTTASRQKQTEVATTPSKDSETSGGSGSNKPRDPAFQ